MIVLLCTILLGYIFLIGYLVYGCAKVHTDVTISQVPSTRFTIVVPFRNESANIPALLACLSAQQYPHSMFEVIMVDDDSDDRYNLKPGAIDLHVIKNVRKSASPKKDALAAAIQISRYEWIVTTDADCCMGPQWLLSLDSYIQQHKPSMVAGPVRYTAAKGFLNAFQQLDMLSLQGATIGSFGIGRPFMCNGANFAYSKKLFFELDGFAGNENHAGGDDVFLLQKAASTFPEKIGYLKNRSFIVDTSAEPSWGQVFRQRVRWAAKAGAFQSNFGKLTAVVVLFANIATILALVILFIDFSVLLFSLLLMRTIVDWELINKTSVLMQRKISWYVPAALTYPFFSTAVACRSFAGSFNWKGRQFKN